MSSVRLRGPAGGALLTLAWYAVLLAVVFTTAFWVGRLVGPVAEPSPSEPRHDAPHVPTGAR